MADIKIVHELHTDDRQRLDALIQVIENLTDAVLKGAPENKPQKAEKQPQDAEVDTTPPWEEKPQNEAQEPTAEPVAEEAPMKEEAPKPAVTLEQIQQKVMQLATADGGSKKAQTRAVISEYGSKVSDLKDKPEKWAEVWEKLTALEV